MNFETLSNSLGSDADTLGDALDFLGIELKDEYSQDEFAQLSNYLQPANVLEADVVEGSAEEDEAPSLDGMSERQKRAMYAQLLAEMEPKNAGQGMVNAVHGSFQKSAVSLRKEMKKTVIDGFDNLMCAGSVGVTEGIIEASKKYQNIGKFTPAVFTQREYKVLPTVEELKALKAAE